jgi:hypothetical protein
MASAKPPPGPSGECCVKRISDRFGGTGRSAFAMPASARAFHSNDIRDGRTRETLPMPTVTGVGGNADAGRRHGSARPGRSVRAAKGMRFVKAPNVDRFHAFPDMVPHSPPSLRSGDERWAARRWTKQCCHARLRRRPVDGRRRTARGVRRRSGIGMPVRGRGVRGVGDHHGAVFVGSDIGRPPAIGPSRRAGHTPGAGRGVPRAPLCANGFDLGDSPVRSSRPPHRVDLRRFVRPGHCGSAGRQAGDHALAAPRSVRQPVPEHRRRPHVGLCPGRVGVEFGRRGGRRRSGPGTGRGGLRHRHGPRDRQGHGGVQSPDGRTSAIVGRRSHTAAEASRTRPPSRHASTPWIRSAG